jgi:cell wall-associated NlpC family hydrolase
MAAAYLEGKIAVPKYVSGTEVQVSSPSIPIRKNPRFDAELATEALYGEIVIIYDEHEGWAWVQLERDNYVGYAPANFLSHNLQIPTHRVGVLRTFVYPQPDIKSAPMMALSLGSRITAEDVSSEFVQLTSGGFIYSKHVREADRFESDFVAVAERFAGTPYLWGGRQSKGIDCSGLVQISMEAAGQKAPRDSDMQQNDLGMPITDPFDFCTLQRGDLIFWKGHVGIMTDTETLLHANAHHMQTVEEPLNEAIDRIAAGGAQVTAIKRLSDT